MRKIDEEYYVFLALPAACHVVVMEIQNYSSYPLNLSLFPIFRSKNKILISSSPCWCYLRLLFAHLSAFCFLGSYLLFCRMRRRRSVTVPSSFLRRMRRRS